MSSQVAYYFSLAGSTPLSSLSRAHYLGDAVDVSIAMARARAADLQNLDGSRDTGYKISSPAGRFKLRLGSWLQDRPDGEEYSVECKDVTEEPEGCCA